MFSYRVMQMHMDGNLDGNNNVSTAAVLQDFTVSPTDMDTTMQMFSFMYGLTDQWTLMGRTPYVRKTMHHVTRMGIQFGTHTDDFGDTKFLALNNITGDQRKGWVQRLGVSLPTGSSNEKVKTPASMGKDVQAPFPMQIGSGTYDLIPALTYSVIEDKHSWGVQGGTEIRLGTNSNGYTLGDRFKISGWYARG